MTALRFGFTNNLLNETKNAGKSSKKISTTTTASNGRSHQELNQSISWTWQYIFKIIESWLISSLTTDTTGEDVVKKGGAKSEEVDESAETKEPQATDAPHESDTAVGALV